MPQLIRFLYASGVVGLDLNKPRKPMLPSSGGIGVAAGVLAGLLVYIGIQTFVYRQTTLNLVAVTASILIAMFVGFFDDLNVKSRKVKTNEGYDIRVGFPRWVKPLLTLPAAVPLMAISAGVTTMSFPFLGDVNFGIFYPLLIVPIGIVGASNMINMLGGYNGLEAGMGLIYMLSLGLYALAFVNVLSSVLFFIGAISLLAFLRYNWYPAKILPGDSLTYLLGSLIAAGVIIGNMEKIGLIVMTPFIVQGILKFYSKNRLGQYASDLGIVEKDGTIKSRYGKSIFSLTHIVMKLGKFREWQIVIIMILVQIIFGALPFLSRGIF
ncbi:MAG: hypothetical protein HY361_05610 [Candidatus Aenigmarchaeota archaeon]|nr:hypothetical protein [Candidatus Aenigmarchaeota archaeon]